MHSMLLKYEFIAHLVALALLGQCAHQLSTEIVEVSPATSLRLLLLLLLLHALSIVGVVGLGLLLTLLSLLIEGKTPLALIGLIMVG